jgi:S1-C subfamily serine protease
MVPAKVLQRVFFIKASDVGTGTAFTITVDGREYLVTARHVIDPVHGPRVVHVFRFGTWEAPDAARTDRGVPTGTLPKNDAAPA